MNFLIFFALQVSCSNKKASSLGNNGTVLQEQKETRFCSSPNTKITKNGSCICNSNFYGDPNSPEGCWTCDAKCHYNGLCVKPNKCECKKNYFGDGIVSCKRPKPMISSFSSDKCNFENTEIFYATQKVKHFKPDEVFCRFGSFISYGEVINRTYFKCNCPLLRNGIFDSSLSFDNEFWSSQIQIEFDQDSSSVFSIYTYVIMISLVISFVASILWYRRLFFDSKNDTTEVLPLNKWYMHQIQQEIGEENRIIDFISHIITG